MESEFVVIESGITGKHGEESILKFYQKAINDTLIKICVKCIPIRTKDDYSREVLNVLIQNRLITKDQYNMIRYHLISQFHECITIDTEHILQLEYGYGFNCSVYLFRENIGGYNYEQTDQAINFAIG